MHRQVMHPKGTISYEGLGSDSQPLIPSVGLLSIEGPLRPTRGTQCNKGGGDLEAESDGRGQGGESPGKLY